MKLAGSGAAFVVLKSASALSMYKIVKYVTITLPKSEVVGVHGLENWPAFRVDSQGVLLSGSFWVKVEEFIKTKLIKAGVPISVRPGFAPLQVCGVGAAVAVIGFDIYTIVDAWANKPEIVVIIETIHKELTEKRVGLQDFAN